ncbi:MAG: KilA-N domain-containing protein [Waterburya sp.]
MLHDYAGIAIELRDIDGYVNATRMSKAHLEATGTRRDASDWLRLERTKETMNHLSTVTGIPVTDLVETNKGNKTKSDTGIPVSLNYEQGTFIHPKLAVRFGIWLSDDFGLAVEEWIQNWIIQHNTTIEEVVNEPFSLIPDQTLRALEMLATARKQGHKDIAAYLESLLPLPVIEQNQINIEPSTVVNRTLPKWVIEWIDTTFVITNDRSDYIPVAEIYEMYKTLSSSISARVEIKKVFGELFKDYLISRGWDNAKVPSSSTHKHTGKTSIRVRYGLKFA